ncbi:MAG: sigma-70 family RNA polymerase sigma factor [Pseudomonadota bacterium]
MSSRSDNTTLEMFLELRGDLVTYASSITGCRSHAEDVVQDAFLRFREATRSGTPKSPVSYLYRVVRNLAIDRLRGRQREGEAVAAAALAGHPASQTPEDISLYRDQLRLLTIALAELDERTRRAVVMHRVEGAKLREIGDALGVSTSLAHSLVVSGMEHCRRTLERD